MWWVAVGESKLKIKALIMTGSPPHYRRCWSPWQAMSITTVLARIRMSSSPLGDLHPAGVAPGNHCFETVARRPDCRQNSYSWSVK